MKTRFYIRHKSEILGNINISRMAAVTAACAATASAGLLLMVTGMFAVAAGTIPVIHKTATDRIISPVGTMAMTPNFAIGVVGVGNHVVVEAAGDAFRHTLTLMDAENLGMQSQIGFLKGRSWRSEKLPGVSRQSLFQGLAAGPHGMIYAAGGVSNNVLALQVTTGGTLKLLRKYPLAFQAFSSQQYPYTYQGEHIDSTGEKAIDTSGEIIPSTG